jgi:hypothetical protein
VYPRGAARHGELGALGNLDADVGKGKARDGARNAADDALAVAHLVGLSCGLAVELEHSERAIHVAAVMEACERLLARVAALREGDGPLIEACLGGQDALVQLAAPARRARQDAKPLELVVRMLCRELAVEHLDRRNSVVGGGNPVGTAEDDRRGVLLGLDLALGGEAHPRHVSANGLAELGLGQEQEVVFAAPPHEKRRDHAALRRQDQRLAGLALEHVVRDDPLQEIGGVGPADPDEGARPDVRSSGDCTHLSSLRIVFILGTVFRSRDERKVREAGIDPARLPPGQHMTVKWPVLHAGSVPHVDLATWTLRLHGEVEEEVVLDWAQFNALPRMSNVQDIHCVTRWSKFDTAFEGVHWSELAKLCRPLPTARFVVAWAEHDFSANVPLASIEDPEALLATHGDGEPLTLEHGYPLRLVVPHKYFWKSAKWLRGIELRSEDRLGFWERYGYNNDADPWLEERYSF